MTDCAHFPRLLADIGGTNARFALETAAQQWTRVEVLACADYACLGDAVRAFLQHAGNPAVRHAAMAVATPVAGDWVQMTNHHWAFSIEHTRRDLGLDTLLLLNDFTAQALAVAQPDKRDLLQIGGGEAVPDAPKAVIGAGTGLGVSGLLPAGNGTWLALAGEGGHASFAPQDDAERQVWQLAAQRFGHVSAERVLSGAGLALVYEALAGQYAGEPPQLDAAEITRRRHTVPAARRAVDVFCGALGTAAGNLALTLGARGGVYLCGGIVPRLRDDFAQSPFRARFEHKGRFSAYLAAIPAYIVLAQHPGLTGASAALRQHLRGRC
ncbi:glucokinase [Conchiformibius kuhniae]|uniref:Glucokinase n=1 Tax=Conchiformibius kuhniae TaxID=211502 RepID=A0A8T9MQH1_9NEIS|nr:glucokinase [Conchiformibius kuhniae]UOP04150.1 glucokinase [Conchiformibius kuhniae]